MEQVLQLSLGPLAQIRTVDPMMMSYNVEFAEVTGGTFWKAYTPEQIAGTEPFVVHMDKGNLEQAMSCMMQVYPPIDLRSARLRKLAAAFGPAWVRVSGTWATKTYYDFDGSACGIVPEGYLNILTRDQWIGVLDFVRSVGAKLMISVANCAGLHSAHEPWNPSQAEQIFRLSEEYGVPIDGAEFANEPNYMESSGFPAGYTPEDYRRDQDLFFCWLKENYPDCIAVGPSASGPEAKMGPLGGLEDLIPGTCTCAELMEGTKEPLQVFSYHYYSGVSERTASMAPGMHWSAQEATSEVFLDAPLAAARAYLPLRDRYVPGAPVWVTESGDAGGGGDTWASTYLDVFRTLNELGGFSELTDGVIFHNTLASSDYGFLQHGTFEPRPNYFAVLLWNRLMGNVVYDSGEEIREGAHVYARSRRDGRGGLVYLVINNSGSDVTAVRLPKEAEVYALAGENGDLRAPVMTLNGRPLVLEEDDALPDLSPDIVPAGVYAAAPGSCTFFVL